MAIQINFSAFDNARSEKDPIDSLMEYLLSDNAKNDFAETLKKRRARNIPQKGKKPYSPLDEEAVVFVFLYSYQTWKMPNVRRALEEHFNVTVQYIWADPGRHDAYRLWLNHPKPEFIFDEYARTWEERFDARNEALG